MTTLLSEFSTASFLENSESNVVIAVPRHDLGEEQVRAFQREHGTKYTARVWRGRGALDPLLPGKLMCWRNDEAELLNAHGVDVETHLCKQGRGAAKILCPFFSQCAHQRQRQPARLWFVAHELLTHRKPKAIGEVGVVFVDESPLDALLFGLGERPYEMALDLLTEEPREISNPEKRGNLASGREALHRVLAALPEGPVPKAALKDFSADRCAELHRLEWEEKIDPGISPDMDAATIAARLQDAGHNAIVTKRAMLWRLIGQALTAPAALCGRLEISRSKQNGRMVRMRGIKQVGRGWVAPTLIADATLTVSCSNRSGRS
jgi:hypothetical protein